MLWLPTRSGVSQRFCQWAKFVLMYRVSQKKAVKLNPGKILRKCNFNFFNVKNWPKFCNLDFSGLSYGHFLEKRGDLFIYKAN